MAKKHQIATHERVSFRRKTTRVASGSTHPPDKLPPAAGYAVGYGRPPTWAQFRPGRSGDPKGRPKKGSSSKDRWRDGRSSKKL